MKMLRYIRDIGSGFGRNIFLGFSKNKKIFPRGKTEPTTLGLTIERLTDWAIPAVHERGGETTGSRRSLSIVRYRLLDNFLSLVASEPC